MAEKEQSSLGAVPHRIYYAARDGMAMELRALLQDKSLEEAQALLSKVVEEDGQKCTPLIIAAKNGHRGVVQALVNTYHIDMEQEGTVKFDGYIIEGASALWCAAGAGHLSVVKLLVKCGANIDHTTLTNSTPLRAACFDGRLDIVKYLVEHTASIHIANKYNNTCLMIAAYKGHFDVVEYLLEKGADPNTKAQCGATALHFAAECGYASVVKIILEWGAEVTFNENNVTPLMSAAERTRADVVNYFLTRTDISREEKIDALELLGASYANDKDNYSLELAYEYLQKGMTERYRDNNHIILKTIQDPIPAYENWIECQTSEELESIQFDANALHMESLVIRERILGLDNPEVPHPVIFRGAVFADNAKFDRCIDLWLHALELRQRNNVSVGKDLLRFAQVFSQMIHVGIDLPQVPVKLVLNAAVDELERNKKKLAKPGPKDDPEQLLDELEGNTTTILYLIVILTKVIKDWPQDLIHDINCAVYRFTQANVSLRDGQTPLHLAVNPETPVDDFHTVDVCRFPSPEAARLLIQCGADVNAMDKNRNTPLHIIVSYQKPITDFLTLHTIIRLLVEANCHMDTVNAQGLTPLEAAGTAGVAEIILKTQLRINLKCMAATAINKYKLTYQGLVPTALETFIELHSPGVKKG